MRRRKPLEEQPPEDTVRLTTESDRTIRFSLGDVKVAKPDPEQQNQAWRASTISSREEQG